MYAVIVTGGKQYRVAEGDKLKVEKLDLVENAKIDFDQVLMIGKEGDVKVGAPYVSGGKVSASVVRHGRGKKIRIVKVRRRKNYRRTTGHRQYFTEIQINSIVGA